MYIRKKPVAVFYKLSIGIIALVLWWYLLVQNGWSALRLFPTWILGIAAVYFVVSAAVLALKQNSESGKNPYSMFEGMILMGFFLTSGIAIASTTEGFYLPELPVWVIVVLCGILPVLVLLDWLFFVKKGRWRPMDPFYWLALPACYCATIIFTAELFSPDLMVWSYPIPALDYMEFGLFDMLGWMLVVAIIYIAVGYLLFLIDFAMSGKLAKKIVLLHIRTIVVDENGVEKVSDTIRTPQEKTTVLEKDQVSKAKQTTKVAAERNSKKSKTQTPKSENSKKNKSIKTASKSRPKVQKTKIDNAKLQDDSGLSEARNSREASEKAPKKSSKNISNGKTSEDKTSK